jgi:hypothetical protein
MHFHFISLLTAIAATLISTSFAKPFHSDQPYHQDQSPMSTSKQTIYFGYGSNLWLHQMSLRCPDAKYLGIARLNGYKWLINDRGYANVVELNTTSTSTGATDAAATHDDVVYGMVYTLTSDDEDKLDKNEGVPIAYTKEMLECDFWSAGEASKPMDRHRKVDVEGMCIFFTWGICMRNLHSTSDLQTLLGKNCILALHITLQPPSHHPLVCFQNTLGSTIDIHKIFFSYIANPLSYPDHLSPLPLLLTTQPNTPNRPPNKIPRHARLHRPPAHHARRAAERIHLPNESGYFRCYQVGYAAGLRRWSNQKIYPTAEW